MTKLSPFDFVNDISEHKRHLIDSADNPDDAEFQYNPWIVNLAFSKWKSTVEYANDVNKMADLPKRLQHDYLFYGIKAMKRPRVAWPKEPKSEAIDALSIHYGINKTRAREVALVLRPEEVEAIMLNVRKYDDGGTKQSVQGRRRRSNAT